MKTIIERGASWTLEETKMLLALWGQDLVQRQATNTKRTKEVYEKISEKFNQNGYERTADQVRTRVFNMIAEYRRILKDPNPERMKKCIFFEALHKIYQAKHMDDVKSALDDYEPEYPYSPASNNILSEKGDESVSDFEAAQNQASSNTDGNDTVGNNNNSSNNNNNLHNSSSNNSASTANAPHSGTHANNNVNNSNINSNNHPSNKQDHTGGDSNAGGNSNSSDSQPTGPSSKRVRLESPKSDKNNKQSSSDVATNANDNVNAPLSSKQANKSSSNAGGGAQSASALNDKTSSSSTLMSSPSTSSSSVSQRHQSLLLPHVSASASSPSAAPTTPINKLSATSAGNTTQSYININSTKLPTIGIRTNQLIGHSNGSDANGQSSGTGNRSPTTATISHHQLYQAPVNTFDVTSSALLIDRMFAHLSRESENMREWIGLEKERLASERVRRQQEAERDNRRERVLIDTLMRYQEQWLSFMSRLDPRIIDNASEKPPELKIPPKEPATTAAAATQAPASTSSAATSTNTTSTGASSNEASQQNAPQDSQNTNYHSPSSGNSTLMIDLDRSSSSSQTSVKTETVNK